MITFKPTTGLTLRLMPALALALACTASLAQAQNLLVYDDALRNGFVDGYSYGGGTNLAHTQTTRNGSPFSIAFTGNDSNAVAFPNETVDFNTAQYSGLRFYVHGGTNGGQQLRFQLYNNLGGAPLANVELDSFITGGAIAANSWRLVEISFASAPLNFSGSFDRFDLQADGAGAQATLYLDDIELIGASADTTLFGDGFEDGVAEELLFVPQYASNAIKIYRRTAASFNPLRTVPLGAGVLPNALAFAPDGHLWVVDNGQPNRRLLRYSRQSLRNDANPVPSVVISPVGGNAGEIFDLAFFGNFAYVSQSNFAGVQRVLRYALSDLAVSGSPPSTHLTAASLNVPAGLAFDAQGRLWISNFGNDTLVRMNASSGVVDRIASSVPVGVRDSLSRPEGLAFDSAGTLWVGNNGEPTISAYAQWQLDDPALGATLPVHQIDINAGLFQADTVGGLAFDGNGDLWANYQKTFSVLEYQLVSGPRPGGLPGVGSYVSTPGQVLANGADFPGFGGLAIWPIPPSMHMQPATFRGTTVVGMEMHYAIYPQASGPIGGTHYPVHDTRLVDYFASKGINALRFLFSWEGMQSSLMGPIPASSTGNYRLYFDRYKAIVDYATNVKGMQVIIEPWQTDMASGAGGPRWRGNLVGSAQVPTAAWVDFWSKLAAHYADNPKVAFGLVNEPNNMSTMGWWAIAQAGINAIRSSGATQRIYVPGNGYTAASTWVIDDAFYDTDPIRRSNAYGWLNANGPGIPINDPLNNLVVEVHTYLDADQGGSTTGITSVSAARQQLQVVVNEARARGYQVYLGEIGMLATEPLAPAAWADFIDYFESNNDTLIGYTWWAGGAPGWWDDIGANGGGHFAITPTDGASFTGDTVNMDMIEGDFVQGGAED